MNYFKVKVARAHMGSKQTQYDDVYIATEHRLLDVYTNKGKIIAGCKKVINAEEVDEEEFLKSNNSFIDRTSKSTKFWVEAKRLRNVQRKTIQLPS